MIIDIKITPNGKKALGDILVDDLQKEFYYDYGEFTYDCENGLVLQFEPNNKFLSLSEEKRTKWLNELNPFIDGCLFAISVLGA